MVFAYLMIYPMLQPLIVNYGNPRPVKINGSPVLLTENAAVFRKTESKKNHGFSQKTLMSYRFFFFGKKPFLGNNFAKVAEMLRMKINIDIIRTLGSRE